MSDGPFRDNLENRVTRLQSQVDELGYEVEKLRSNKKPAGPSVISATKEHLSGIIKEGWVTGGSFVIIIFAIMAFSFPSCVTSCKGTPEQMRLEEEARQAQIEERRRACEDISMHYVGFDNQTERLTCANEENVVTIDLDSGESWSVPVIHERE